jgi:hypothetical protein
MAAKRRRAVAAVIAALTLSASSAAHAYCRTSSCGKLTGTLCEPPDVVDCGIPIFWPSPCITVSLQEDASKLVSLATSEEIFKEAFGAWTTAACPGGGTPHIQVEYTGPVSCDKHEYNQTPELGNANIIIFRDNTWPHVGANSTLALTTVTYNTENGEIYDADMEINTATAMITTTGDNVKFDFLSIATHEAGHFLGLSHSQMSGSTMTPQYMEGSTNLQTLEDDDRAAICAAYPPGDPIPDSCDSTPRHGFSPLCSDDPREVDGGCCSVTPGAPSSSRVAYGSAAAALAAMALLATRRRRAARAGRRLRA